MLHVRFCNMKLKIFGEMLLRVGIKLVRMVAPRLQEDPDIPDVLMRRYVPLTETFDFFLALLPESPC